MADILSAITPIFAVILVGYLATRFGLFKAADMSILNRFVVKIGLPMLIFFNLAGRPASEIFNVTYLLIYGLAAALVMGLAQLYGKVKGTSKHRATFMGMGMAGTNNGFMGFPIFLAVIPAVAGPAVGMDMIIDNLVTIPITLFIAEQAMQRGGSLIKRVTSTLVGLFTNPLIIAIIAALAVSALKIDVPAPVMSSVELLARTSSGVALFAVGGTLVGLKLGSMAADIVTTVVGKLVLMPAVALGLVFLLGAIGAPELSNDLKAAAVLTAALPTFSVLPALAERFGESEFGAATVMTSTIFAYFTMTSWMFLLSTMGWM